MAIFNFSAIYLSNPFKFSIVNAVVLSGALLTALPAIAQTEIEDSPTQNSQIIEGESGGFVDSQGCGFISEVPNHQMSLPQRIDYMRLTVQTDGGQPTLLVLGPNSGDSFCVLGDEISGLNPEISGVWEAGNYEIYVGDRSGSQHQFVLNISTDN